METPIICITCEREIPENVLHFVCKDGWATHYHCKMPTPEQIKKWAAKRTEK